MSEIYQRENPHRLYRDKKNAVLAGVCAGIADYFGFNRKGVRVAVVLTFLFPPFIPFVIVSYIVLAIVIPVKPQELYVDNDKANFWRGVSNAPAEVFSALSHRFKSLNLRLEKMEAYVTSKEFSIDRELGRGPGRSRS
ncbi:envelope stress response membrane protein PspC [Elongatibacter sediminis]|uniref:Envelope stress response membrane protein PspC n=1 Tax=Elongatibacter sediminis TaxID=3119006 RepID=A0AAW9R870_9GAMM